MSIHRTPSDRLLFLIQAAEAEGCTPGAIMVNFQLLKDLYNELVVLTAPALTPLASPS